MSHYPQQGVIACEIIRTWVEFDGRKRCIITTEIPFTRIAPQFRW